MAITLRGVTSGSNNALSTGFLEVALPTGSQVGDSCYIFASSQSGTAGSQAVTINGAPPALFTGMPSSDTAAGGRLTGWSTTLDLTDITRGTFRFTRTAATGSMRIVATIIVTSPTAEDTSVLNEQSGNTASLATGSANAAGNDLAILIWGVTTGTSPGDTTTMGTPPAGFTEYVNTNTANASQRNAVMAVDIATVSAGTAGPYARTASGTVQPRSLLLLLADTTSGVTPVTASDTLSAAVTDVGTFATVAVSANDAPTAAVTEGASSIIAKATITDTLSAATTDVSAEIKVGIAAADSLSVSIYDFSNNSPSTPSGISWSDPVATWSDAGYSWDGASLTTTSTPTGTDSLSAAVTDTASIAISGLVTKTASDTLSAAVTDAAALWVPRTASDTLSAAVTDTSSIQGQIYPYAASDTLSASVDDVGIIDVTIPAQVYDTTSATFTFEISTQGFTAVLASNATSTWDSVNGNPAPSLKITRTGKSNLASQSYWELVTTWQTLGVPAGSVVTEAHLESAWNRVSAFTSGTGVQVGPYDIRNAAGNIIGTLWSGRAASAVDGGTVIGVQPTFPISGADAQANATVRIRLYNTIGTTSTGNPTVAINDDQISLTIVSTPPLVLDEHFDDVSASVTETSSIAVTKQLISASDSLTATGTDITISNTVKGIALTASDALSASVTDVSVRATLFAAISATDTLSAADTEISMVAISLPGRVDTLSTSVTETAQVRVGGNLFPAYDSDVIYNDVAEYNGGGQILKTVSDTLSASVTESTAFGTIAMVASDTLSASVTDTRSLQTNRTAADSLVVEVAESTTVVVGNTAVDALSASATEGRSFGTTTVSTTDTLSASVTENRSFGTTQISAADTLAAMITLEGTGGARYFSSADVLSASETEFTMRLVNGNVIITSQDILAAAVTESYVFSNIPRTASDTLSASVTDTRATTATTTAADTLSASVSETARAGVSKTASDTLSVAVTEASGRTTSSKYPAYVFDNSNNPIATIPMLWTGTAWIEVEQLIWNGSVWV
jgi:hypothetical protein